ncbi:LuxR C-terminal-related transcriptional regulator [Streptomyces luteogriseus]|uniref:LuxR C-terminal-related transcriptional regulator n=1 Tax=Streptomyces luteogriseus TaxID=68233 RepID=UPI0036BB174F
MTGDSSRARTAPRAGSRNGRAAARSAAADRGHAELARGRRQLFNGPVGDARETLLLAATLLAPAAPETAEAAHLSATDAAWASGDVVACLATLDATDTSGPADGRAAAARSLADEAGVPTAVEGSASTTGGDDVPATPHTIDGPPASGVVRDLDGPPASGVGRGPDGLRPSHVVRGPEGSPSPHVVRGPDGVPAAGAARGPVGSHASDAVRGPDGSPSPHVVRGPEGVPAAGAARGPVGSHASDAVRGPDGSPSPHVVPGSDGPPPSCAVRGPEGAPSPHVVRGPEGVPAAGAARGPVGSPPSDAVRGPQGSLSPHVVRGADSPPPPGAAHLALPLADGGQWEASAPGPGPDPGPGWWVRDLFFRDYRDGMRALLARRPELAAGPLRRVLDRARRDDRPERLLRAAAAALLLGDVHAARTAGSRALAAARATECAASEARALEYLAYGELRAGRHAQARTHAEEGVRAALIAGHRNTAASHHAMLALAASIEGDTAAVAGYASAALATARRHGLAQAATLAEWATARADLARGRPLDAADRLGPLVRPGPRRGHFAVWMLAVPCFVEAAVLAGQPEDARDVVADLARWAAFGADPHAPAQHARCRALLATDDREADDLYLRALALHDESGGDFERARTELLYGRWLRRRRRLREARSRLGAALVGFDRCGAGAWADQARGELRANGAVSGKEPAAGLSGLTPQQLRIARHVAEGATNREVAQRLAVSTRTVDYHLRNVFAALGVRSRMELARMVDQEQR